MPGCTVTLYGKRYDVLGSLGNKGWLARAPDGCLVRIKRSQAAQCTDVTVPPSTAAVAARAPTQATLF